MFTFTTLATIIHVAFAIQAFYCIYLYCDEEEHVSSAVGGCVAFLFLILLGSQFIDYLKKETWDVIFVFLSGLGLVCLSIFRGARTETKNYLEAKFQAKLKYEEKLLKIDYESKLMKAKFRQQDELRKAYENMNSNPSFNPYGYHPSVNVSRKGRRVTINY